MLQTPLCKLGPGNLGRLQAVGSQGRQELGHAFGHLSRLEAIVDDVENPEVPDVIGQDVVEVGLSPSGGAFVRCSVGDRCLHGVPGPRNQILVGWVESSRPTGKTGYSAPGGSQRLDPPYPQRSRAKA